VAQIVDVRVNPPRRAFGNSPFNRVTIPRGRLVGFLSVRAEVYNSVVAPERPDTVKIFRKLQKTHGVSDIREPCADEPRCTTRLENTHGTEFRDLL
jgi:hypothetical protein